MATLEQVALKGALDEANAGIVPHLDDPLRNLAPGR